MQRLNSRGDRWPACAQAMYEMAHQPVFFVFILLIICLFYIRKPTHLSIWTRGSDMYHHLTVYFFSSDHFSTIPTLHLGVSVRSYLVNPPPLLSPSLPLSILFDPLSILHCLVTVEKEGVHTLYYNSLSQVSWKYTAPWEREASEKDVLGQLKYIVQTCCSCGS